MWDDRPKHRSDRANGTLSGGSRSPVPGFPAVQRGFGWNTFHGSPALKAEAVQFNRSVSAMASHDSRDSRLSVRQATADTLLLC